MSDEEEDIPHVTYRDRIVRLETQVKRIVSDIESEKETRARSSTHIDSKFTGVDSKFDQMFAKLAKQDRLIFIGVGIVIALQAIGILHRG